MSKRIDVALETLGEMVKLHRANPDQAIAGLRKEAERLVTSRHYRPGSGTVQACLVSKNEPSKISTAELDPLIWDWLNGKPRHLRAFYLKDADDQRDRDRINTFFDLNPGKRSRTRRKSPLKTSPRRRRNIVNGKEGKEHKRLKEWLAENYGLLGLTHVSKVEIERPYISGDAADIVFSQENNSFAVVEIETTDPLPGVYQAIKYRTLLCAEKGLPLDSARVKAILVAWAIPENIRRLCKKYDVKSHEVKLTKGVGG